MLVVFYFTFRTPNNTVWKRCMRCKDCSTVYPQHGLNPSIYDCEKCGNTTTYAMYKYRDGELIVKDK